MLCPEWIECFWTNRFNEWFKWLSIVSFHTLFFFILFCVTRKMALIKLLFLNTFKLCFIFWRKNWTGIITENELQHTKWVYTCTQLAPLPHAYLTTLTAVCGSNKLLYKDMNVFNIDIPVLLVFKSLGWELWQN